MTKSNTKPILTLAFTLMALLPLISHAKAYPTREATCYFFKGNKLQKKTRCVVQGAGGAGGYEVQIKLASGKTYRAGTYTSAGNQYAFIGDEPAREYERDKSLKVVRDMDTESAMKCFRADNKKVDLCYTWE